MSRNIKGIIMTDRSSTKSLPRPSRVDPYDVTPTVVQNKPNQGPGPEDTPLENILQKSSGFDPITKPNAPPINPKDFDDGPKKRPLKRVQIEDAVDFTPNTNEALSGNVDISDRSANRVDMEADQSYQSTDTSRKGTTEILNERDEYIKRTGADIAPSQLNIKDSYEEDHHQMMTNPNREYNLRTSDPTYNTLDNRPKGSTSDHLKAHKRTADAINKVGKTSQRRPVGLGAKKLYGNGPDEVVRNEHTGSKRSRPLTRVGPSDIDNKIIPANMYYSMQPLTRITNPIGIHYSNRRSNEMYQSSIGMPSTRLTSRSFDTPNMPITRKTRGRLANHFN